MITAPARRRGAFIVASLFKNSQKGSGIDEEFSASSFDAPCLQLGRLVAVPAVQAEPVLTRCSVGSDGREISSGRSDARGGSLVDVGCDADDLAKSPRRDPGHAGGELNERSVLVRSAPFPKTRALDAKMFADRLGLER
ncbi:hypothetical protein [Bradyrhizobium sp. SZCCHNRI2007]|uniref:hypothetical protein n=1 Tax=Bradyrhizobium sp. SZCCHNRI2007 TaxID=3057281 RepID=UPI0028E87942|nr:hypothetical protein [Bradyrhizobium sp. SZCCHNRI2007]